MPPGISCSPWIWSHLDLSATGQLVRTGSSGKRSNLEGEVEKLWFISKSRSETEIKIPVPTSVYMHVFKGRTRLEIPFDSRQEKETKYSLRILKPILLINICISVLVSVVFRTSYSQFVGFIFSWTNFRPLAYCKCSKL